MDKDNYFNKNYFQRNTSPSQILFDSHGKGIKRTYIGPQNYISQPIIERALTPTNFGIEIKRLGEARKIEFENTRLRGKHAPSSIINNPGLVKVNKSTDKSFLTVNSPFTRK